MQAWRINPLTSQTKAKEALRNVEKITDTEPVSGEELLESEELKRFQRKGLGYSKDLETHKAAVALFPGVYNFVRVHKTLGITPAVAAGVELERWSLEHVVEMTRDYVRRKEDAEFERRLRQQGYD